jgi:DNA mismatch repair protein MutS
VLRRAREVLHNLEELELDPKGKPRLAAGREDGAAPSPQLSLFAPEPHPALDEIRELDLDSMSPLDALNYLARLRRQLKEDS